MRTINRSALIVRYREPYLRWAASIDDDSADLAKSLGDDFSVYLLPQDPDEREESAPVEEFFEQIFAQELEDWCRDETRWPKRRDIATFCKWFDVRATSVVTDLGSEPLKLE